MKNKTNAKTIKKQNTKQFYNKLLVKKYENNTINFISDIKNINHIFWPICRDFAKEILLKSQSWSWLAYRIDDFAIIIERDIINKLDKWNKKGSFSILINDLTSIVNWLFDRHVNSLKNLFDARYKHGIQATYILEIDEQKLIASCKIDEKIALMQFKNYSINSKIKILKKLWKENMYDSDFDMHDMEDLCREYRAPPAREFLDLKYDQNYGNEQAKSGNFQLIFRF